MRIVELIIDELEELMGFDAVALVNQPAIEAEFHAFNSEQVDDAVAYQVIKLAVLEQIRDKFVSKIPGESKDDYIARCIPALINEGYDQSQASAICYNDWQSFDETEDPQELIIGDYQTRHYDMCPGASALYRKIENQELDVDMGIAIRAARLQDALFYLEKHVIHEMQYASFEDVKSAEIIAGEIMTLARMMGLEQEHQYILGHVQAIRELYQQGEQQMELDPSALPDFIDEIGDKKKINFESYTDYPQQAIENAKIALRWAEENGWGDCGTPVGKARANQLANGEPISEETIARMAAFERHRQNSDKELGDGCGRLVWLAWGGDAGIEWAQRKLKQIREERLSDNNPYFDNLPVNIQDRLIETLGELGYSIKDLEEDYILLDEPQKFALPTANSAKPSAPTNDVSGNYKILYEYVGPRDTRNRSFCRRLLDLNLLFRKEDIQNMTLQGANSQEFGYYDIFEYKGSFGCRHSWRKKYAYQRKGLGLLEVAALLKDQQAQMEENLKKPQMVQTFSKQYTFATEEDKMMVTGPIMIPHKLILRVDEKGEPYYVYFTENTIGKIARKMMEEKKLDQINIEHDQSSLVDGFMVETWIVEDPQRDKQQVFGMNYPKGSWLGTYKINDPKVWQRVKNGELRGYSIEGFFDNRLIQN